MLFIALAAGLRLSIGLIIAGVSKKRIVLQELGGIAKILLIGFLIMFILVHSP